MSPRIGLDLTTIVITAVEILDTEGLEAVTLAAIARKLNVRSPSLFNHIKGLPELKRELSLYGLNMLSGVLESAVIGKKEDEAIFALANAYVQFSREHPGLYELTLRIPEPDDSEMEMASSQIINLLNEIFIDYHLTDNETIHAIRGFRSILHGFSSLNQKNAFGLPVNLEESFQFLLQGYISFIHQLKELR